MPNTEWLCQPTATPNEAARAAAIARQNELTKPPGSLGRLETVATDFAAWQGVEKPALDTITLAVFAGDHGVVTRGVSAFPQSVTAQMIANFAAGGAAVAVLAREARAAMTVVNLGTVTPTDDIPGVINHQLAPGTADFTADAAMPLDTLADALAVGAAAIDPGASLFVGGEMGIGNTTSAAAVLAALIGLDGAATVGRGTGVDDAGLAAKRAAVDAGLARHAARWAGLDAPDAALAVLACVGGLEIAALTGAYVAAPQAGVPVLIDGFISSVAALAAVRINPGVADWLVFGHRSAETGHARALAALGAEPILDLGMRLGEGSGAMTAVPVIRAALAVHAKMATFAEAGVGA
ncbi:nicotinate-nucleotide--dimethylbenzimidazole phosphoribosyltransferase [Salinisphaera sp. Q1T1-3]|uniref:nicotinate-nucleotide--dimethylbenzimidazole phosphoribosyltransferase n=1 Tax=Salinisphaera sp. Q1T1-3 TaxID=2321229 RepID=UPI000E70F3C7|nr:nicotinate-nucleotide--dimethylbenzimidazole phosphoribosyltransferase [Salinisphaera sp. Q1T1-3]RJS92520.1 nicotinate-nucleotide--dimethylbenzimidazole phosphoribosyltransferase [Salinisphaera sp. Q1T1-3]